MIHNEEIFLKIKISCLRTNYVCPNGFVETASSKYVAVLGYCTDDGLPKIQNNFCNLLGDIIGSPACNQRLKDLNGSYAAVVICPSEREIHIISDRWGTRPLFYAQNEDEIDISSDYWQVVNCLKSPKLSMLAAVEMMSFDYVLGQHTIIEDVFELTRASHAVIRVNESGTANFSGLEPLWNYDIRPEKRRPKDLIYDLADVLREVGKRHANILRHMGVNTIGLNLTKGFDSRVIAYMLHSNQVDFHCFTSRSIGGENEHAFQVSQCLGVPHIFLPYWLDDNLAPAEKIFWESSSTNAFFANHTMNLAQYGPWPVQGFISGHYGDPVTGRQAKLSEYWISRSGFESLLNHFVNKQVIWNPLEISRILRPEYRDLASSGYQSLKRICENTKVSHVYGLITRVDAEQRQRRHILKDYHCLCKLGVSVLPFSDYALWDFFETVPFEWQIESLAYQSALCDHLFKGEYQELQRIPINGIRRHSTSSPMLMNCYLSLRHLNSRVINRVKRKLKDSKDVAPPKLSVFAKKEIIKLYPLLEMIFKIDEVARLTRDKQNDHYFVAFNFWALYTLGRILARLNNCTYNWG